MAVDPSTAPAAPAAPAGPYDLAQLQALAAQLVPQQAAAPPAPVNRSIISLLGEALGGGASDVAPAEREAAGTRALLNFGANLSAASGPSVMPRNFGQILAQGVSGAEQSLGSSAAVSASRLAAQQQYQEKQQELHMEALKTAIPLLRMQAGANVQNTLIGNAGTGAPGTSIAAAGNYEGDIGALEGSGKSTTSTAAGFGQFIEPTWNSFVAANPDLFKGMTPQQILDARNTPEIANKAITWLAQQNAPVLAKAGVTPSGPSLALAHRLGPAAAAAVMQAPENAPVADVLVASIGKDNAAAYIKANPELGMATAGALRQKYAGVHAPGFLAPADGATAPAPYKVASAGPTVPAPPAAAPATRPGATSAASPVFPPGPGAQPGAGPPQQLIYPEPGAPGAAAASAIPLAPAATAPTVVAPPAPGVTTTTPATPPVGKLTFEQFQAQHPIVASDEDRASWTVTPPDLTAAKAAQAEAARQLSLARAGISGDPNKSLSDYNTATQNAAQLQQQADAKSKELQQAWLKNRLDTQRQLYNDEMTRVQQADEADKQRAAAVALKTQEGQQAIDLAKVQAGQTWHQKLQEQAATAAQENTIKPMAAAGLKAHQMNLGLSQMLPILQDLPPSGGALGAVLDAHPDLAPLFNSAGILNDKQADAVRLINGLVSNISTEMKPTGLGALREYEWDAFKAQLPSMLSTPAGQQKAVAMLMNMNNRIQQEGNWMNSYFSRKIPDETTPGRMVPAHNLENDDPSETVQQRMDKELGPIIPSYSGLPSGNGQTQWEQSLPPGKPYYKTWARPDPQKPGQPLRDGNGNVLTTKTLEVRPWQ